MDPALDNLLRGETSYMSTDEFGQLRPFEDLMFNYRLGIFLFLLSAVLPLDVFRRAMAEVVARYSSEMMFLRRVRALLISAVRRRTSASTPVPWIRYAPAFSSSRRCSRATISGSGGSAARTSSGT